MPKAGSQKGAVTLCYSTFVILNGPITESADFLAHAAQMAQGV